MLASSIYVYAADIEDQEIDVNMSSNGRILDDELLDFIAVYFPNEFMAHGIFISWMMMMMNRR